MGPHLQRAGPGYDDAGVARFYGGLVRGKNILGMIMQSVVMLCQVRLIWILVEYSLASALIREGSSEAVNGWPSRDSRSILWML
jgi:ammonia channel protein AmtB